MPKVNWIAIAVYALFAAVLGYHTYTSRQAPPVVVTAPVTPPPVVVPVAPVPEVKQVERPKPAPRRVVRRNQDPKCRDVPTEAYRHPADRVMAAARRLEVPPEKLERLRWCINGS